MKSNKYFLFFTSLCINPHGSASRQFCYQGCRRLIAGNARNFFAMKKTQQIKWIGRLGVLICAILMGHTAFAQVGVYRAPATAAPFLSNSPFADWGTYVGDSAGYNMNFGFHVTLMGHAAGFSLNNDADNTVIGSFASYHGTTGIDNVIVGARAGFRNNGSDNTLIGNMAGYHNTTGLDLTFIGEDAGYYNTTGSDNVFMGEDAGYNNTTGSDNTFIGNAAGRQNTTGYRNTAIGNEALFDLGGTNDTNAHHNTAVGDSAGIDNGEGTHNTFFGAAAGAANEHADRNTFIGAYAGYDNNRVNTQNSNENTYVGFGAGYRVRTASFNVLVGSKADATGFASGINRERHRITGLGARLLLWADDCIGIGHLINVRKQFAIGIGPEANVDGTSSIGIGYQTVVANGADNSIAIGNQALVDQSNTAEFGNAATKSIRGAVNWTAISDKRLKTNIKNDVPGLTFINRLNPVTYQMDFRQQYLIRDQQLPDDLAASIEDKHKYRYTGFLAQDVWDVANALGFEFSGVDPPESENGLYGLRYAEFVVPLVKAVQELNDKVEYQEKLLASREQEVQFYQEELVEYRRLLEQLAARVEDLEYNNSPDLVIQRE